MIYSYPVVFAIVGILLIGFAVFTISVPSENTLKMKLFRIFSDKGLQLILTAIILGWDLNTNTTIFALVTLHIIHTIYVIKYQKNI
jgi:hypothetical protein